MSTYGVFFFNEMPEKRSMPDAWHVLEISFTRTGFLIGYLPGYYDRD
jgi:hypothetical protein